MNLLPLAFLLHGLEFTTPATTWDEALPLGNGLMGALVWGDGKPLRISLDRADLWDLRPVPEFAGPEYKFAVMREWEKAGRVADLLRVYEKPYNRPAPTKIPAGRIVLTLPGDFVSTSLDVGEAIGRTRFAGNVSVEVMVHAVEPAGMIRVRGARPEIRLEAPPFGGQVRNAAAGGISSGDLAQLGYPPPRMTAGADYQAFRQEGWGGFAFAVHVVWAEKNGEWVAAWSVGPEAQAKRAAEQALGRGWAAMAATHAQWWNEWWNKVKVTLPNKELERQWYLDTYKFGAAARRSAPPITLQAVWTADNGQLPPWKGDYHHDLNTQLSYWPAYSGNRLEEQLGYLDWLWTTRGAGADWTRRFFELPGLNVPMTADLEGKQIGGWRQYTHSATTAAWLAQHFYLHWKYSGDAEFLRARAYPYAREAAIFLEAYTAQRDAAGKRTFPLSSSPEINDNKPSAWFPAPTNYDVALTRWLFGAVGEMAQALGLNAEVRRWRDALQELPPLATDAEGGLLVAPNEPLRASHRHFSHLMAIHPLGLLDVDDGAEARKIVHASLGQLEKLGTSQWTGYSFAWLGNLMARARDGEKAERALEIFARAFCLRNSFHANGDQTKSGLSRYTYRPFTLEGNFAAAAGVQEMLLQSHRGVVRIFPAIPTAWKDVSFSGLRAQGGFVLRAERRNGRVVSWAVQATTGGAFRYEDPLSGKVETRTMKAGEVLARGN